jgi:hypothetical protein
VGGAREVPELELGGGGNEADAHPDLATLPMTSANMNFLLEVCVYLIQ